MRDDPQPAATRPATPAGEPAPATPAPASEHAPATVAPTAPAAGSATTTLAAGDDVASALLSRVLASTARATGEEYLQLVVRTLAETCDVAHALVAEPDGAGRARTRALWSHGAAVVAERTWPLDGTPCAMVLAGQPVLEPSGVRARFAQAPAGITAEGYAGVPLVEADGQVRGLVALLDERPGRITSAHAHVLEVVAARTVGEFERIDIEHRLRESQEQFRDLFEEAPIAYVYEETSTRFVSANRAALDLLGLAPDEVSSTHGLTLVAPAPDVQERVQESLASEQSGHERGAIEVELRRKSDGRPVWVQRWSRPEPDGKHTRTMLIDITARVLAERERTRLQQQNRYLREEIETGHNAGEIVGASPAIRRVLDQVRQVATTDATVLLLGETGTGKELVARALHAASPRRARPLIKLNCAALPEGLVESELFGHERGAFTGATEKRIGRFALADGGTIFLDEIGELAPAVQAKLLRVLQERAFEAVGSTRTQHVDVRVIAATNRDLQKAVADGTFRADLFYRLNVFPIAIPALAERRDDIPLLVHHFVARYAAKTGRHVTSVEPRTMQRLMDYPWPGNIRELENVIERAVILARGPVLEIDAETLRVPDDAVSTATATPDAGSRASAARSLAETQRRHILDTLRATNWVIDGAQGAARRLGLQPSTLRGRMKKLGITRARS